MYRVNQSIMEKTSNKIAPIDYQQLESWKPTEDIEETFKELTRQLNNEIDLYKKDPQSTLSRKDSRFDI